MLIVFFSFLLSLFTNQQNNTKSLNDPAAKVLLDAVTKTYKSYNSFQVTFSIITEYPQGKSNTQNGQVFIKGEKYKLLLGNQEIFCDKTAVWTYLKDINEVQINDYEPNQSEITPANMFTIYHSDFNYMMNTNENIGNISCKVVDLMPKDKTKPYFKIRLWIDSKNNIKQLKMFDKNGTRYTYKVNILNTAQKLEDSFFIFDAKKHAGIHIEDLRM
jgi:outer membrane lipoprotein carrier protein